MLILKKLTYFIRVITVAPIMALVLLLVLIIQAPSTFGGTANFILAVLFLSVFPLLAYPLQPFINKFKDKGREGQRTLAMYFAVAGYILGCLFALALNAPKDVSIIYFSYLLSGSLVLIANKVFHFKASGHACGIAGPFILLVYFQQPVVYLAILVLGLVWLASLYVKRHTLGQLFIGTVIPFAAMGIILMIKSII